MREGQTTKENDDEGDNIFRRKKKECEDEDEKDPTETGSQVWKTAGGIPAHVL